MPKAAWLLCLLLVACKAEPAAPGKPGATGAKPTQPEASTPPKAGSMFEQSHRAMGTTIRFRVMAEDRAKLESTAKAIFAEFDRLDRQLSVWHPNSEVSQINAAAGLHPVVISNDSFALIERAIAVSKASDGAFDLSFAALSGLWRFDHDHDDKIPDPKAIAARLPSVDYRQIALDPEKHSVFLKKKGMSIHLGGIGKGYAVDRGVKIAKAEGLTHFILQAGGDLFLAGERAPGTAWRVGIQDPRARRNEAFAMAPVVDQAFSSSGDYERYFIQGNKRYHHILDPKTGQPASKARSVTVLSDSAELADALSTAIFVLGAKRGLAMLTTFVGTEAVIVDAQNKLWVSNGLKPKLKLLHAPTDGI